MSPRIRCSKVSSRRPKVTGTVSILGRVFTTNRGGASGPEDNHVGLMRDSHGQLTLTVAGTRIPVDVDDLRRIGDMCATEAAR